MRNMKREDKEGKRKVEEKMKGERQKGNLIWRKRMKMRKGKKLTEEA